MDMEIASNSAKDKALSKSPLKNKISVGRQLSTESHKKFHPNNPNQASGEMGQKEPFLAVS